MYEFLGQIRPILESQTLKDFRSCPLAVQGTDEISDLLGTCEAACSTGRVNVVVTQFTNSWSGSRFLRADRGGLPRALASRSANAVTRPADHSSRLICVAERGILLFRRNGNRRWVRPPSDCALVAAYSFASRGAGRWKNSSIIHGSRFHAHLSASRYYDSGRPLAPRPPCPGRNPRARPACLPVPPTLG